MDIQKLKNELQNFCDEANLKIDCRDDNHFIVRSKCNCLFHYVFSVQIDFVNHDKETRFYPAIVFQGAPEDRLSNIIADFYTDLFVRILSIENQCEIFTYSYLDEIYNETRNILFLKAQRVTTDINLLKGFIFGAHNIYEFLGKVLHIEGFDLDKHEDFQMTTSIKSCLNKYKIEEEKKLGEIIYCGHFNKNNISDIDVYYLSHELDWKIEEKKQYYFLKDDKGIFIKLKTQNKSRLLWLKNKEYKLLQDLAKIQNINFSEIDICIQQTRIIAFIKNTIVVFKYIVFDDRTIEKRKNLLRYQKDVSTFLLADNNYKFKHPIDAGKFEELIIELLREEEDLFDIKTFGQTNERDGGRDLEFQKFYNGANVQFIGQVKAYTKSIAKKDILDLRDLLEQFDAKGFFLASSTKITVTLHDYFNKLKRQGYLIDWWEHDLILYKLKQNPDIMKKYKNLFEKIN